MNKDDLKKLQTIKTTLENEREPYIRKWKQIASLMAASYGDWGHEALNNKKLDSNTDIYDNTANESSNLMADGLMGTCFGRSISWFKLVFEKDEINNNDDAAKWLVDTEKKLYKQLNKSNFYDEARQLVRMGADFSTAAMWMGDDAEEEKPYFRMLHPKDFVLMDNLQGDAETLFRDLFLTKDEAIEAFGEKNLPKSITDSSDEVKKYKFCQYVGKAGQFKIKAKGQGKYVSVYWCNEQPDKPCKEERFRYKPFVAWRWNRDPEGSAYGTQGPGLMQIANIKSVNTLSKNILQKSQLIASPPIKRTEGLEINLLPAGITDLKAGEDFAPVNVTGDLSFTEMERERIRNCIREAYYTNFFLMLSRTVNKQKTATEVAALMTEQSNIMAAFFNRLATEFLEPVLEFVYGNEMQNGRLSPLPISIAQKYQEEDIDIDFISPMFMIQKQTHTTEQPMKAISQLLPLAQVHPDILMRIDWDRCTEIIADGYNVRKEILIDDNTYQRMKQAAAEQQMAQRAQANQMAQAKLGAEIYKDTSKAPEQGSAAEMM